MLKFGQVWIGVALAIALGPARGEGQAEFVALRDATFMAVWQQVGTSYYDADFGGKDWERIGEKYRRRLRKAKDMAATREIISAMLYELGESHLSLLSSDYEESELASTWNGGWAGVALCYGGEKLVFYEVDPTGAAYRAGLRPGDTLLSIDGRTTRQLRKRLRKTGLPAHTLDFSVLTASLSRFRGSPGEALKIRIEPAKGPKREVELTLDRYQGPTTAPLGHIGTMPLTLETQLREDGIAYLRFDLWFPAIMPEIRTWFAEIAGEAEGLVIDLRGNPGGVMLVAGGLAGMLVESQRELGRTQLREGHINIVAFPQRNAFLGKVALLVDEASASTSEVFAIGLQEWGRAKVFGQPTPGAALPSVITSLPNGDYLQVALGDFKTPRGTSLEGRGVEPDVVAPISPIELSQGRDSVLEIACDWVKQSKENPL